MTEVLELESGVDPVPVDSGQEKMTETEKAIQNLMRRSYTLGVASGMRTMCVSFLSQMNQTKQMNPQRSLTLLKQMCMKNIENQNKVMQMATDTKNTTKKENEDNV